MPETAGQVPEILTAHRFYLGLTLDGQKDNVDGFFLECQGFKRSQDAIEITEVTPNKWGASDKGQVVRTKIPGNVKSGNITLKRGMTNSLAIWKWFETVQEGKWASQRKNAALTIYDQAGKEQARFELAGAWPASYKIADVNARSSDIEIEEIEVAYEEFKRVK
ncbi:phage tail protein [Cuspidothrix issatschenkoi LEGE 03284]|uniref:phage tail protein n=1 Tax=Cuspidothrix issatschenkoi TaxID=230752 RepID=UPI00187FF904|nr:phage tail protein [Cuspidothrix issatschenkoi]MBE9232515.1 phage tail protein [Cuspidothrix issatschenkoi LEGE 03284]